MSIDPETAVSYAALILADEGLEVTPEKLQTLLKAAGVEIEPIWSTIFSNALKDKDIKEILTTVQISTCPSTENDKVKLPVHIGNVGEDGGSVVARADDDDANGSDSDSDIGLGLFD